jgi:hypothetical protein
VYPLLAVSAAEAAVASVLPQHDPDTIAFWCGIIAVIAVGNVAVSYLRTLTGHLHGLYITKRLRNAAMRQLIQKPASWYDVTPQANGSYTIESMYLFLDRSQIMFRAF